MDLAIIVVENPPLESRYVGGKGLSYNFCYPPPIFNFGSRPKVLYSVGNPSERPLWTLSSGALDKCDNKLFSLKGHTFYGASGSPVVTEDGNLVGLIVASKRVQSEAIAIHIDYINEYLEKAEFKASFQIRNRTERYPEVSYSVLWKPREGRRNVNVAHCNIHSYKLSLRELLYDAQGPGFHASPYYLDSLKEFPKIKFLNGIGKLKIHRVGMYLSDLSEHRTCQDSHTFHFLDYNKRGKLTPKISLVNSLTANTREIRRFLRKSKRRR